MLTHHWLPKKLKKKIIILFFLFTLMFSAIFSTVFFILIQQGEKQLQSIDMGLAIERIRTQYLKGEDVGRINRFFHGEPNSSEFPDWIRHLSKGFHKIQRDHLIWHVMIIDYPDQRYILLRDYTAFESARFHPYFLLFIILSSSLLLSLILTWITIFFVIHPIEKLEKKIREDLSPNNKNQLTDNYAEHEIGQLAQAFDEVYDKLNQALQRERLFTADVSHELRTPLMVILSSCELLSHQTLENKAQQRIHNIQLSAEHILQRLQVYFALARQTSSTDDSFQQLPIIQIAKAVITENHPLALRYNITIKLQAECPDILHPVDFCHTILSNLVRNAIEYAGGQSTVTILLHADGFTVFDDGIGIEPEYHPYLFDSFVGKNHPSTAHLGLGLSLVKRICQYLNWQIDFSSQPQFGTRFTILTQSKKVL